MNYGIFNINCLIINIYYRNNMAICLIMWKKSTFKAVFFLCKSFFLNKKILD
ncbi:hypothetical protein SAMN05216490_0508 [Mucilaginibacter mallensis]|uniref:Uncharacterized protein n=1 Tax=Mucilaginibacter mallensis TaxID=652787 RepID=A0A1H1PB96_MUCMA|nr:hypothetical protein SAMN05216490_0508 [Mucilaginibacter mallensis]